MSDMLRISTPIVNPNQATAQPQAPDPTSAFFLQDTTKVIKSHNQRELYDQNTGTLTGKTAPDILMDLIQDPTVTATYLKNLSMIEEIYKLVPAHNLSLDPEVEKLFNALLLQPEDLVAEMMNQEETSTSFHGELFDFLRDVSTAYRRQPEVQFAIADFLKAVHTSMRQEDLLGSVANNLLYLKNAMRGNTQLTENFSRLASAFMARPEGPELSELKNIATDLLNDARSSLLLSEKIEKIISITTYNLSRCNANEDFIAETAIRLRKFLSEPERKVLTQLSREFLEGRTEKAERETSVMDRLTKIIERATTEDEGRDAATSEKIDDILFSLLSSPCNFTPLLHYIIPLEYFGTRAFTELWINPESGDNDKADGGQDETHLLMVMDVDGSGRFEVELYVHGKNVDFTLYCPDGLENRFKEIGELLREDGSGSEYRFTGVNVLPLKRGRSLMEVFKSLPYRRVGVDVTV